MKTGTKIILKEKYNDYPAGTVAIYLYSREDYGTYAAIVVLDDKYLAEEIKGHGVSNVCELVERYQNNLSLLECSLTTLRPVKKSIINIYALEDEVKEQKKLLEDKTLLLKILRSTS
jgi:predicted transcriptional regulator with HTH domain